MKKKIIIVLALALLTCKTSSISCIKIPKIGGMGALPPRWLMGVTVYNETDKPIEVRVDKGISKYTTILPGENKLVKSKGIRKKECTGNRQDLNTKRQNTCAQIVFT